MEDAKEVELSAGRCAEVGAGRPVPPVSARRLFGVAAAVERDEVARDRAGGVGRRREEVYLVGRTEGHLIQYFLVTLFPHRVN